VMCLWPNGIVVIPTTYRPGDPLSRSADEPADAVILPTRGLRNVDNRGAFFPAKQFQNSRGLRHPLGVLGVPVQAPSNDLRFAANRTRQQ
jgi:hypothetical protein